MAADGAGNVYIADYDNHQIRKVAAGTGILTTVAGGAANGFSGDGGPATAALLSYPLGLTVDAGGNLYLADRNNQRIRKVDAATGIITTVAGNGNVGVGGDGGAATAAELCDPWGLAVDGTGNLYIGDSCNYRVRKVDAATGIITTIAGTGTYGFSGDGGAAIAAQFRYVYGLEVDAGGNVYIADGENYPGTPDRRGHRHHHHGRGRWPHGDWRRRRPGDSSLVNFPLDVAIDAAGNLLDLREQWRPCAESRDGHRHHHDHCRQRHGGLQRRWRTGDGRSDAGTVRVDVDAGGSLYIADVYNHVIRRVGGGTAPPADGPPYTLHGHGAHRRQGPGCRHQLRRRRHGVLGDDARANDARAGRDAQRGVHVRRLDGPLRRGIAVAVARPEGRAHLQRDVHGKGAVA